MAHLISLSAAFAADRDIGPATQAKIRHHAACWHRHAGNSHDFSRFRYTALDAGLSRQYVASVETTIGAVLAANGIVHARMPPLRLSQPHPDIPSAERIARVYGVAGRSRWPRVRGERLPQGGGRAAWLPIPRQSYWRALIAIGCWWGLRRSDMADLTWQEVDAGERIAIKTGRTAFLVGSPMLDRHLAEMRKIGTDRVFGVWSHKNINAEWRRLSAIADVEPITCQCLRRFAISAWSAANAEAGRIIHGCGLGVMRYYVGRSVVESAAQMVRMPDCFCEGKARHVRELQERTLLGSFRRASVVDREMMLRVAQKC